MCIISGSQRLKREKCASFNLRKQQTWANGKRREKYNYDKNTHTHRFQNAALNEKYHGLFSCANTLSSSFSCSIFVFLLLLRYLSSFGVAQPPVAYVIIEQNKNKHSPCEIPFWHSNICNIFLYMDFTIALRCATTMMMISVEMLLNCMHHITTKFCVNIQWQTTCTIRYLCIWTNFH